MLKFEKIKDKELVVVKGQKNCRVPGKSIHYGADDCLNDCSAYEKPRYYASENS